MPHTVRHLDRLGVRPRATAARDLLLRRRPPGRRGVSARAPGVGCAGPAARRAVARRRGGRGQAGARRARRGHPGRGIGVRGRDSGPLPGGRRRTALTDPQRAGTVPAGPGRAGGASAGTSRSRRGPTRRGALGAGRRGLCDTGGRRLCRHRDPQSSRGGFDSHLEAFRDCGTGSGHAHGPDRAAGPLRQQVRTRAAGRVLLVGDAAGYVDALTGEGMGLAFGAAELVVIALPRTARGLRPAVAEHDPAVPGIDGGAASGQHLHRCARASCPPRRRCPVCSEGSSTCLRNEHLRRPCAACERVAP